MQTQHNNGGLNVNSGIIDPNVYPDLYRNIRYAEMKDAIWKWSMIIIRYAATAGVGILIGKSL